MGDLSSLQTLEIILGFNGVFYCLYNGKKITNYISGKLEKYINFKNRRNLNERFDNGVFYEIPGFKKSEISLN